MYIGTELLTSPIKEALYIPDASLVRNERNFSKKPNETTCRVGSVSSHLFPIVSPLPRSRLWTPQQHSLVRSSTEQYRCRKVLQDVADRSLGPASPAFSKQLWQSLRGCWGGGSRRSASYSCTSQGNETPPCRFQDICHTHTHQIPRKPRRRHCYRISTIRGWGGKQVRGSLRVSDLDF